MQHDLNQSEQKRVQRQSQETKVQHPASTSVQPVEPSEDSDRIQNAPDQQEGLRLNVEGPTPQAERHPDLPAGQHATGSFTGVTPENPAKKRDEEPRNKQK